MGRVRQGRKIITVLTYVEGKPTIRCTEQEFEVLELAEVSTEICPAGFGNFDALYVGIFIDLLLLTS